LFGWQNNDFAFSRRFIQCATLNQNYEITPKPYFVSNTTCKVSHYTGETPKAKTQCLNKAFLLPILH
jgi:hypothetical protein